MFFNILYLRTFVFAIFKNVIFCNISSFATEYTAEGADDV